METVYVTYKKNGGSGFQILKALDRARTQLYHFNAILIAGMGFFTDAYDLFCISSVTRLLGRLYYYDPTTGKPGSLPPNVSVAVTGVALCGTLAGQLFFGCLGDRMGRKRVYGITLIIMVAMSIASGLSFGKTAKSVMATLCFFRFWLGFGVGGDYPLSAVIMSEYANTATRGAFLAAVFAMQGIGILVAASVSIIVAAAFKNHHPSPSFDENAILSTPDRADYAWRIIFMLGAIPAALTFYWRMRMPETARYTALIEGKLQQASQDMAKVLHVNFDLPAESPLPLLDSNNSNREKFGLFSWEFAHRHGRELVGTACAWFFLDIAYYSGNLFQKDVLSSIGWLPSRNSMSALEELYRVARAQALIALCATVPGYWVTIAVIDRIGRKPIQLIGFFFMTAFMLSISIPYYKLRGEKCPGNTADYCNGHHTTFLILYSFTFFFANFGPNSTTFIIPAELFPARLRSTCHGISAACGKAGAVVGAFGFLYAAQSPRKADTDSGYPPGIGYQKTLFLLAATNGIGFFFTFLLPETKGKSLEELSGEIPTQTPDEHKGEAMAQRKRWRLLRAL